MGKRRHQLESGIESKSKEESGGNEGKKEKIRRHVNSSHPSKMYNPVKEAQSTSLAGKDRHFQCKRQGNITKPLTPVTIETLCIDGFRNTRHFKMNKNGQQKHSYKVIIRKQKMRIKIFQLTKISFQVTKSKTKQHEQKLLALQKKN